MKAIRTKINDVVILEPKVFGDGRGFFYESYNERVFEDLLGYSPRFVQDNHSFSVKGVLRGLHYQVKQPQAKLVRSVAGEIFDVAVDIRLNSPTYGVWVGVTLSASNRRQLWIPEGLAHGFLVMSDAAEVVYKVTDFYLPEFERAIVWNDPELAIAWPKQVVSPILSAKDAGAPFFRQAEAP